MNYWHCTEHNRTDEGACPECLKNTMAPAGSPPFRMSPLHLEILLRAYYTPDMNGFPTESTDKHALDLESVALLAFTARPPRPIFHITKYGRAYVSMLLATPLPGSAFIDPRTKEVIEVEV